MPQTLARTKPKLIKKRVTLTAGSKTTVHIAQFDRRQVQPRIVQFEESMELLKWCNENSQAYAVNGGFFTVENGRHMGELWLGGKRISLGLSEFNRGCLHIDENFGCILERRNYLPEGACQNLIEAGPLLVKEGEVLIDDCDAEGFSSESKFFDSDISSGRHPRTVLAANEDCLWALVCEGRHEQEAGLTLKEAAEFCQSLGATEALNLDGGSSSSLVFDSKLINTPRTDDEVLASGRAISTAIIFE